ncbi:PTS sugar transporter subunit IIB [Carnobacterium divergens]|uniref:PTS sugar transporter subunit IIB n=1 Tax=Carnobacterium divergens TaxID=2748 RepID=UPI000D3FD4D6|nr:PTS sugar transporter subunit IIB [Carnobacterium divergens]MCO6018744.1 PTS sugar transporter subunit IIB [Carnobacterium divergens]TFI63932.1 PTS sugar transporter subunit IIB [Carnobacterium divergens]TFI74742.1 PTS sugar transporter subunit IIB [Carnobacterium divergens]TFI91095.1 PTS sugar transporter subunit IIB [Carnobacterium divergens]TFJ05962.1 PTS sugar transporter subunit IIB [Carnobacterium divergens]
MKTVLLICGGGASSGFMAANMRKAAKKRGAEVAILARSESELDDYIEKIDVLLIGPHLAYIENEVKERIVQSGRDILVKVIPQKVYGMMNGNEALDLLNQE